MPFAEDTFEQAIIELFETTGYIPFPQAHVRRN